MMNTQVVRFHISELMEWLAGREAAAFVAEALTAYFNWAVMRGWRLQSMIGFPVRKAASDFWAGPDEVWTVVWVGEDTQGSPDFMPDLEASRQMFTAAALGKDRGAAAEAAFLAAVCEALEDRGWKLDEAKDGYFKAGELIPGEVLARVGIGESVAAVVEQLERSAWRKP